ncbi:MAG: hypothetical protein MUP76_04245 [Acidimicrobiia bacterium]|nr:hypothetical protein [Acidimicrobiia bacterium]
MSPRYLRILIGIATAIVVLLIAIIVIVATGGDDQQAATTVTTEPAATTVTTTAAGTSSTSTTPTTAATTSTSATTTAAPTTTTTTTTSAATTTTAAPSGACSGLPSTGVGGGATDQTVAFGDVDGDGADDEIVAYHEVGSWWLNVETAYGWSTEVPITGMVARAVDVVDLGVSEEVIIAQTDAGASVEILGFFAFQGCNIVHLIDGNTGFETAFALGGTVTHLDGFRCTADGITVTSARNDLNNPNLWEYTETDYLYVPGLGELQPLASSIQMLTSPGDDATIFGAATYGC